MFWLIIYKHIFSQNKCLIWNNKDIRSKNKTLFIDCWVKNGILFVTQLLNEKGHLLTYTEFLNGIPLTLKEFVVVLDAIPSGLLKLMQGNVMFNDNPYFNFNLMFDGICNKKMLH